MARLSRDDRKRKRLDDLLVFNKIRSTAVEHHWVGGKMVPLTLDEEKGFINSLLTNQYTRFPTKKLPADYLEEQMDTYRATARFLSDEARQYLVEEMHRRYRIRLDIR